MSEVWDLELRAPCTIALSRDRAFEHGFHLHGGGANIVQLAIGSRVLVRVRFADGDGCDILGEHLGERVLQGVVAIAALTAESGSDAAVAEGESPDADDPLDERVSESAATPDALPADDAGAEDPEPADDLAFLDDNAEATGDEPVGAAEPMRDEEALTSPAPAGEDTNENGATEAAAPVADADFVGAWEPAAAVEPDEVAPAEVHPAEVRPTEVRPTEAEPAVPPVEADSAAVPEAPQSAPADFDITIPDPPLVPAPLPSSDLDATVPGSPAPVPSREADFAATVVRRALPAALDGDLDATIVGPSPVAGRRTPRRSAPLPARIRVVDASGIVEHELSGVMYVGRAPELPVEADRRRSSLVAVAAGEAVAETHAQLTAGDGLVLVRDLWSAGGTRVEQPNGGSFQLLPGEQIPVARGARILLGDGVVLETVG